MNDLLTKPRKKTWLYRLNRFAMANLHSLAAVGVVALIVHIILSLIILVKIW